MMSPAGPMPAMHKFRTLHSKRENWRNLLCDWNWMCWIVAIIALLAFNACLTSLWWFELAIINPKKSQKSFIKTFNYHYH
jgi:hypothetical protein